MFKLNEIKKCIHKIKNEGANNIDDISAKKIMILTRDFLRNYKYLPQKIQDAIYYEALDEMYFYFFTTKELIFTRRHKKDIEDMAIYWCKNLSFAENNHLLYIKRANEFTDFFNKLLVYFLNKDTINIKLACIIVDSIRFMTKHIEISEELIVKLMNLISDLTTQVDEIDLSHFCAWFSRYLNCKKNVKINAMIKERIPLFLKRLFSVKLWDKISVNNALFLCKFLEDGNLLGNFVETIKDEDADNFISLPYEILKPLNRHYCNIRDKYLVLFSNFSIARGIILNTDKIRIKEDFTIKWCNNFSVAVRYEVIPVNYTAKFSNFFNKILADFLQADKVNIELLCIIVDSNRFSARYIKIQPKLAQELLQIIVETKKLLEVSLSKFCSWFSEFLKVAMEENEEIFSIMKENITKLMNKVLKMDIANKVTQKNVKNLCYSLEGIVDESLITKVRSHIGFNCTGYIVNQGDNSGPHGPHEHFSLFSKQFFSNGEKKENVSDKSDLSKNNSPSKFKEYNLW